LPGLNLIKHFLKNKIWKINLSMFYLLLRTIFYYQD
jgi:hypothetical protein